MKQDIELTIEKIVLHGIPAKDGRILKKIMEFELSRLLTENGLPDSLHSGTEFPQILAKNFIIPTESTITVLGRGIADHVYNIFHQTDTSTNYIK